MAKKREVTASVAAKRLEAFGYVGGPQWKSIDNFVERVPKAKAALTKNYKTPAVTANKGIMVRRGFNTSSIPSSTVSSEDDNPNAITNSYINDSGTLVQEYEDGSVKKFGAAGNVVDVDAAGNVVSNVAGTHTLGSDLIKTGTVDLSADQQTYLSNIFDVSGSAMDNANNQYRATTGGGRGILRNRGERVSQVVNQGGNVYVDSSTGQVMLQAPDGSASKLSYNAALNAYRQGLITGGQATYTAPEEEEEAAPVLGCTNPNATNYNPEATEDDGSCILPQEGDGSDTNGDTGGDDGITYTDDGEVLTQELGPTKEEITAAAEIFTDDGVVIPTGFDEDTVDTGTGTGTDTGTDTDTDTDTGTGTGTSTTETVQTPVLTGPTGTTEVPVETFGSLIDDQKQQFIKRGKDQAQLIQPQTQAEKIAAGLYGDVEKAGTIEQRLYKNRLGMSTYILGIYNNNGVWTPSQPVPQGYLPYDPTNTLPYLVKQAADAPITSTTDDDTDDDTDDNTVTANKGVLVQGYQNGGQTVTVAGQELTEEQVAQGMGDLSASTFLDPAGTAIAAPVSTINPDTAGAVLGATTGQALTTAPIVTDPAQVSTVTAADAVTKVVARDKEGDPIINPNTNQPVMVDMQAAQVDPKKAQTTIKSDVIDEFDPAQKQRQKRDALGNLMVDADGNPIMEADLTKEITGQVRQRQKKNPDGTPAFEADGVTPIMETYTDVSDVQAAQGTTGEVGVRQKADPTTGELMFNADGSPIMERVLPKRSLEKTIVDPTTGKITTEGETITGSTVDQARVGTTFGTGEVQAASIQDELTTLMNQFEGGNTPPWAAGAMRRATAVMAQRGLGASSMAGQAIIQAAMEASLPIAQIDTANKQQMALAKAEQRAKFMQIEFDQEFQTKVMNAAKVSEIANMNFTADQQVALENAKMAQTVNLANLNNRQAIVMAEAAQLSQLELAGLSNAQQAQIQNAQNFLQIDMANLSNEQQTEIFKAQTLANTILSDTATANASAQFNASSENQTQQFVANIKSQLNQFNSAQTNAMKQFNAGEANAILKFNSELQNQREVFNATMYAQIAQANAKWRQDTTVANAATMNQSNFQFAKDVNGLTNKAIDQIWQKERDLMSFAMQSSEAAMDRSLQIILGDKDLTALRMKLDAEESAAKGSLFTRFLFGSGFEGGFGGILKSIPFFN
jgi:hypothetical protein